MGPKPPGRAFAQVALRYEPFQQLLRGGSEELQFGEPERKLRGGCAKMRAQHIGIGGIEDVASTETSKIASG